MYCDQANSTHCLACDYQFQLINNKCESYGVVELSSQFYSAIETDKFLTVTVNRYYGSYSTCNIFYEVLYNNQDPTIGNIVDYGNNPLNKMEMDSGMLTYNQGETFKQITLKIFSDNIVDLNYNQFYIRIFNPIGGCYIGNTKLEKSTIEIFEDDSLLDITSSSSVIKNISSDLNGEFSLYLNSLFLEIEMYSYKYNNIKKIDGLDIYVLFIYKIVKNKPVIDMFQIVPYMSNNIYSVQIPFSTLKSPSGFVGKKVVHVHNCEKKKLRMRFYDTAGFINGDSAYFIRNVDTLTLDNYCIKKYNIYLI
jgi:hypothetical protein